MDPRRLLANGAIAFALAGCVHPPSGLFRPSGAAPAPTATLPAPAFSPAGSPRLGEPVDDAAKPPDMSQEGGPLPRGDAARTSRMGLATMAPIPNPDRPSAPPLSGRAAIAAANAAARQTSGARDFLGGVQVFAYDPGRVYEVWTAPFRVTALTLSPGEAVISMAAGDTVRWQIGETRSGEGAGHRAHVIVKPLTRGLETNLVLATDRRVYLVQLRSGDPQTFNPAVTWDLRSLLDAGPAPAPSPPAPPTQVTPTLVTPQRPLDAGYRMRAKGRRPAWTPSAVATDGVRTFLSFPPGVTSAEAPALFALDPDGAVQLVNYRQQGGLWIVDRVLHIAELRMGGRRPQVVRIERIGGAS
jgi:type IV secretion system protein VirB9